MYLCRISSIRKPNKLHSSNYIAVHPVCTTHAFLRRVNQHDKCRDSRYLDSIEFHLVVLVVEVR